MCTLRKGGEWKGKSSLHGQNVRLVGGGKRRTERYRSKNKDVERGEKK